MKKQQRGNEKEKDTIDETKIEREKTRRETVPFVVGQKQFHEITELSIATLYYCRWLVLHTFPA